MIKFFFSFPQWLRVLFSLIYLGIVAMLSMMPSDEVPEWELFSGFDKLVHGCMYFGFTILACWTFHAEEKRKWIIYIVLFAISWGMLMEFTQLKMMAGRDFEWMDELSNSIGALTGAGLYAWIASAFRSRAQNKRDTTGESGRAMMDRPGDGNQ
ncbi:MAG TPA: VanZ family protein [Prolixibacteraceae bacterium]|nr:VanZ family protein [Prolixibacteraceae bacterium]